MPGLLDAYAGRQTPSLVSQTTVQPNNGGPGTSRSTFSPAGPMQPGAPTNPYDLGSAFAAHFGPKPTHQLVSDMAAGRPLTAQPAPTATGAVDAQTPQQTAPGASPQDAGDMNAAASGVFGGSGENGYSTEKEGGGQSGVEKGQTSAAADRALALAQGPAPKGMETMPPVGGAPAPAPAPEMPVGVPPPVTPPAQPAGGAANPAAAMQAAQAANAEAPKTNSLDFPAQPGPDEQQPLAAAYTSQGQAQDPTAPPPGDQPPLAAATTASGASREADGPAAAGQQKKGGGELFIEHDPGMQILGVGGPGTTGNDPVQQSGTSSVPAIGKWTQAPAGAALTQNGSYNDTGFYQGGKLHKWSSVNWQTPHVDPLAFIASDPSRALQGRNFWTALGIDSKNVGNYGTLPDPATTPKPAGADAAVSGLDFSKVDLSKYPPAVASLIRVTMGIATDMKAYGGSGGGAGANHTNDAQYQAAAQRLRVAQAALANYGVSYSPDAPAAPPPAGDGSGGDPTVTPGGDPTIHTELPPGVPPNSDVIPSEIKGNIKAIANLGAQIDPSNPTLGAELVQQFIAYQNQRNDIQTGANIYGNQFSQNKADPNRKLATDLTTNILKNPNTVDEQALENKFVAESDANKNANMDALSSSFARRGIGAAGGAGIAAQVNRQHANDVASGLGDMRVAEGARNRADEVNAIELGGSQYQLYNGGDANQAQNYANIIMNGALGVSDPTAGWNAGKVNQRTGEVAESAADGQKTAATISAATSIAGLLLAIPTGGASLALTAGAQAAKKK